MTICTRNVFLYWKHKVFNTKIRCEYMLTDFEQIDMFPYRVVQAIYYISSTCLFLPFSIGFWNYSGSVVCFVFHFITCLLWTNNLTNFTNLSWLESKISYDPMNNIATRLILKFQLQMIHMNVNIWPWMSFMYLSCWFHYNSLEFHFQVTPLPSVFVISVF